MDLGTLVAKLTVNTAGLETAAIAMDSFSKKVTTMSMRLRSFGWLATTVFTFPFIAGGKSVIQMGRDFEFSMAKIEGLVGIARWQVERWSEELLKMAKTTAKAPLELADTLYYVSSAGFKTNEALKITEMAAKGAATGLGNTKDIANFLTSAMNAYRTSGLSAAQAMDILTAAVREGKGEPAEMSRALGTILPIASELGVTIDQVAGALASMTLITSQTANAATYLRNVLMKLMKPSAGTEKALRSMGTSIGELQNIIRSQGLMPTLVKLKTLTEEYGGSMAEVFPNIRALLGALNLTGQNLKYNEKVMQLVTDSMGDFQKAFFITSQTVAFRWSAALADARSALIELGVTLARVVLPLLERMVGWVKNLVTWFNNLSDAGERLTLRIVGILAAIGPVSLVFSTFGMIIGGVSERVSKLVGWLSKLTKVNVLKYLKASPWVALGAAVIAVGVAIYRHIKAQKELEEITGRVNGAVAAETMKLDYVFERLKKTTEGTKARAEAIRLINEQYGRYLKNLLTEKSTLEDVRKAQEEATKAMQTNVLVKEYTEELDKLQQQLGAQFGKSFKAILAVVADQLGPQAAADLRVALQKVIDDMVAVGRERFSGGEWVVGNVFNRFYDSQIKPLQELTKARELSLDNIRKETFAYVCLSRELSPYMRSIMLQIDALTLVKDTTEEVTDATKAYLDTFEDTTIKKVVTEMLAEEEALRNLNAEMKKHKLAFDLSAKLADLYNDTLVKLGREGGEEAARAFTDVVKKLKALGDTTRDTTPDLEKISDIFDDWQSKMQALDYMKVWAKTLGVDFDYITEATNATDTALKKVIEKNGAASKEAQKMSNALKGMATSAYEVDKAMKQLDERLGFLEKKKSILGGAADFDVVTEKIKAYEDALDTVLQTMEKVRNSDMLTATVLDLISRGLAKNVIAYKELQQVMQDKRQYEILQMEADLFEGMAGKIEVVNHLLQVSRRNLRDLINQKIEGKVPISVEAIEEAANKVQNIERYLSELQAASDLKYFQDMNNALKDLGSTTDLLYAYMSSLENKLRYISATSGEASEEFKTLAQHMRMIKVGEEIVNRTTDALNDMFRAMLDGADESQTVGEKMAEALHNAFKNLIADMMTMIAKMMLLRILFGKKFYMDIGVSSAGQDLGAMIAKKVVGTLFGFLGGPVGAGTMLFADMGNAFMGAKGGVVPAGYPNDTYPAMLSSGEAVVPLHKLEKTSSTLEGDVRFIIEGDKLVGILSKQSKKNGIY